MNRVRASCVLLLVLSLGACGDAPSEAPSTDDLVVERTTENGVEIVRNVSGSTWGAPARLEEELSIGVMEGDEAYMFGSVSSVWATDEEVFVLDSQLPAVRVYDRSGTHLRDIGQGGEGPGEFDRPRGLQVFPDGRIAAVDFGNRRVVFFDSSGEPLDTWAPDGNFTSSAFSLADGRFLLGRFVPPEDTTTFDPFAGSNEIVELMPDGSLGAPRVVPDFHHEPPMILVEVGGRVSIMSGHILGLASLTWTVRPDGALVAGVGDDYRFQMQHENGETIIVERYFEPTPVSAETIDYQIRMIEAQFRTLDPEYTYDGPEPPENWPAFSNLIAGRDNRVWLLRRVGSQRAAECMEDPTENPREAMRQPCWEPVYTVDAFAPDGTYLGELHRPEDVEFRAVFIDGDEYWAAVEDELGVVKVKRYRIVTEETT